MPETDVEIGLPFAWQRIEEGFDAYYHRGLINEFQKIYAERNIYFIPIICGNSYSFGSRLPLPNPDAIKGKKIRATGIYGELVRKLGGVPVVIPANEVYMALKLGTVDGAIFALENIESFKLKEVYTNYVYYIINMDSFNKLPEEIKRLIDHYGKYVQLENSMSVYLYESYVARQASKTYPFKLVYWSDKDVDKVRNIAFGLWDSVAAKSPRCAKLVNIVKAHMRDLGKMSD
jgi:TRAP-type C4-dicarboxylate transport system substrate-binding protein